MTNRERFQALMNFEPVDRLPMVEWAGWWDQTIERWQGEGLSAEMRDPHTIRSWFGLDSYRQEWLRPRGAGFPAPAHHGAGVLNNEAEYEALLPALYTNHFNLDAWRVWAEEQARGETVTWITLEGYFWFPRTLFGIENHLYAFYDQPELMHRMNQDLTDYHLRMLDELCEICTPDFMTFGEDMSYNHGPMLSKDLFDEFMLPYYRQLVPELHKRGILAIIDSDGDITESVPWFEEAGLDGILPLERQSGVDLAVIRDRHPRMRFIGHFDKMIMHHGEAALRAEFERLMPVARQGGFIISVDHQTPPGVSLEDYRLYLRLFQEYAQSCGTV